MTRRAVQEDSLLPPPSSPPVLLCLLPLLFIAIGITGHGTCPPRHGYTRKCQESEPDPTRRERQGGMLPLADRTYCSLMNSYCGNPGVSLSRQYNSTCRYFHRSTVYARGGLDASTAQLLLRWNSHPVPSEVVS
ncbi:hypothetical protein GGR56DRAFT_297913 [Xylariaceae sp. FL0804]|nr:hypothetical protein GGR56DRAFT_297913 [Xylariaceae sp. FL0804]